MDLLPQEIIDKIIDNLPRSSLRSASVVVKRWRTRSQQRALDIIWFRSEDTMNRWLDIQSNPGGISSYLPFVGFSVIEWTDPTLFGRVLRNFNSLTTLAISGAGISDEILEYMLYGELGRITTLHLRGLRCSLSTVMSTILAFPNLRDLFIFDPTIVPREGPSTRSVLSPKRPLDSLLVRGRGNGTVAEALTDYRFMSRRLTLDAQPQNIQKLLTFSSVTIVDLVLIDDIGDDRLTSHPIDLPPFPALISLRVYFPKSTPSVHLIDILTSISSVPALASITLGRRMQFSSEPDPSRSWDHLDTWLVQIGRNAMVEVKGDLVSALTMRREDRFPKVLLPKFKEVGKSTT